MDSDAICQKSLFHNRNYQEFGVRNKQNIDHIFYDQLLVAIIQKSVACKFSDMADSGSIMKTFYVELASKSLNNAVIGAVAGHNFFWKMLKHSVSGRDAYLCSWYHNWTERAYMSTITNDWIRVNTPKKKDIN